MIPRNNKIWIFGDRYGLKYSDNTKAFFDYVREVHGKEIKVIWLTRSHEVYSYLKNQNICVFYVWSIKGIFYSLRAGVVLYSVSRRDINPYFTRGAIHINTWHGGPMKKIGFLCHGFQSKSDSLRRRITAALLPFCDEYSFDYIVNTSSFFDDILQEAFDIKKSQLLLTGYPRNDIFFTHFRHSIINELNAKFNNPRIILYLPTWRIREGDLDPFSNKGFVKDNWNSYLTQSNTILIYKIHPGVAAILNENNMLDGVERIIELPEYPMMDINEIMKSVDILITDYSGAYFDFLLLNKKTILFPYDLEEYNTLYSGLIVDYMQDITDVKCYSWEQILNELITDAVENADPNTVSRFNTYMDGNSSYRLFNRILEISS